MHDNKTVFQTGSRIDLVRVGVTGMTIKTVEKSVNIHFTSAVRYIK